jgi:molybdopterin-guanine dinucleotide biosynthesis protein A
VAIDGNDAGGPAWTGAILAGGRARRFGGRDKSSLVVDGRRIRDRQLEALRAAAVEVLIVANDPTAHRDAGVPVIQDAIPGAGPLGGIYTALLAVRTPRVVVLACDMPFVTAPLLSALAEAGTAADVALPRTPDGLHPLCASYARSCLGPFRAAIEAGRYKVSDALEGLRVIELNEDRLAVFGDPRRLLANVNSDEDYRRLLAGAPSPARRLP